jgi:site-specific DNA recombinase
MYTIDRTARDKREYPLEYMVFLSDIQDAGAELHYVDSGKSDGGIIDMFRAWKAAQERRDIRERTMRGRRGKAKAGHVVTCSRVAYGYRKGVTEDGKVTLVPHEEEARIVRLVYDWYLGISDEKKSIHRIADMLTEMRVPSYGDKHPDKIRKQSGWGKWGKASVARMLSNKVYAGVWTYSGIDVEVEPIVSLEAWNLVQKQREANVHQMRRNRKFDYLLSGRVRCGECNTPMYGFTNTSSKTYRQYYRCGATRGSNQYPHQCTSASYRVDYVDFTVWEWIKERIRHPDKLVRILQAQQSQHNSENERLTTRLQTIDDLITENRGKLERLLDLYLSADIDKDMLVSRKKQLEDAINALEAERVKLARVLEGQSLTDAHIQAVHDLASEMSERLPYGDQEFKERQQIIDALKVSIELFKEDGEQKVKITCVLGKSIVVVSSTRS